MLELYSKQVCVVRRVRKVSFVVYIANSVLQNQDLSEVGARQEMINILRHKAEQEASKRKAVARAALEWLQAFPTDDEVRSYIRSCYFCQHLPYQSMNRDCIPEDLWRRNYKYMLLLNCD